MPYICARVHSCIDKNIACTHPEIHTTLIYTYKRSQKYSIHTYLYIYICLT